VGCNQRSIVSSAFRFLFSQFHASSLGRAPMAEISIMWLGRVTKVSICLR
jgi:hypothetical protein